MQKSRILLFSVVLVALLAFSWLSVLGSQSDAARQIELIAKAKEQIEDEVYVPAADKLLEAQSLYKDNQDEIESLLKTCYLGLNDNQYLSRYESLLDAQMGRRDPKVSSFIEAAEYYSEKGDDVALYRVLKQGIEKTGDTAIKELYEKYRYNYEYARGYFEDVGDFGGGTTIAVKLGDKWGVADRFGSLVLPCEFDKASNFRDGTALVKKDKLFYSVDRNSYRMALMKDEVTDFTAYNEKAVAFLTDKGWRYAGSTLKLNEKVFDEAGAFRDGMAPVKKDGKWHIVDRSLETAVKKEFDEVIRAELGYSTLDGYYFAREAGELNLYLNEEKKAGPFEDARPFEKGGLAAVKNDGKWGFVDKEGVVVIDYKFEDALSFGGTIAPVKVKDKWGFIDKKGNLVIASDFLAAKCCHNGIAPVLTEEGWTFIILKEYKEEAGL